MYLLTGASAVCRRVLVTMSQFMSTNRQQLSYSKVSVSVFLQLLKTAVRRPPCNRQSMAFYANLPTGGLASFIIFFLFRKKTQ